MNPPCGQASSILQSWCHKQQVQPSEAKRIAKPILFQSLSASGRKEVLKPLLASYWHPSPPSVPNRTRLDGWPSRGLEGHCLTGGSSLKFPAFILKAILKV